MPRDRHWMVVTASDDNKRDAKSDKETVEINKTYTKSLKALRWTCLNSKWVKKNKNQSYRNSWFGEKKR